MSLPDLTFNIRAVDQFSGTLATAQGKLGGFGASFASFGQRLGNIATVAAGNIVAQIGMRAMAAIEEFVGTSIDSFRDFEQGMKTIQVFAGMTADEADNMGKRIQAMARDSIFPVIELQESMIALARAGVVGDDAVMLLGNAMTGAAASGESLGAVTQTTLATMRSFGYSVSDTSGIIDILVNSANISQATVGELGTTMAYVGPIAAQAGIDLTDLATAAATLSNRGFEASMIGTSLRQALVNLIDPTKGASEAMAKYGINARDSKGELLPFPEIIDVLRKAFVGMNDTQVTEALFKIFDTRSASAMAALIKQAPGEYNEMKAAISEAGTASGQAAEMMDTNAGAMARMSAKMEEAKVTIGEALAPLMLRLMEILAKLVPFLVQALGGFADIAGAILDRVGPAIDSLIGWLSGVQVSPAWAAISKAAEGASTAIQGAFQRVVNSPVIQAMATAVATAGTDMVNSITTTVVESPVWGDISDAANWAFTQVEGWLTEVAESEWWGTLVANANQAFSQISGAASTAFSGLRTWFKDVSEDPRIQTIITNIGGIASKGLEVVGLALGTLLKIWNEDWGGIRTTVETVWTWITTNLKKYIDEGVIPKVLAITSAFVSVLSWLTQNWGSVEAFIKNPLQASVNFVADTLRPSITSIQTGLAGVVAWVTTNWDNFRTGVEGVLKTLKSYIDLTAVPAIVSITTALKGAVTWVTDNWGKFGSGIKTVVDTVKGYFTGENGLVSKIQAAWDKLKGFWDWLVGIKNSITGVINTITGASTPDYTDYSGVPQNAPRQYAYEKPVQFTRRQSIVVDPGEILGGEEALRERIAPLQVTRMGGGGRSGGVAQTINLGGINFTGPISFANTGQMREFVDIAYSEISRRIRSEMKSGMYYTPGLRE